MVTKGYCINNYANHSLEFIALMKFVEKKTILVLISILLFFYLNLFWIKLTFVHLILAISFLFYPIACFSGLRRENVKAVRIEAVYTLIVWIITLIPTGALILMTVIFGLPPKDFSLLEFIRGL